ncbi:tetratricopeptide repeat protein [Streptomyces cylindrosporus]|uniref:NB-ARC domain-containing protein n=1 Tax=Streptomyces cylindrosporus TaxID=2927583 RepID=A0ABS9YMY5_9ACTN|nr:tetratricopeptide repeat protein [Streptomyces cylindrosporus]MCI3278613.1 NB-ARC domain-containing protein [Streptomyces cylindrosporus]
MTGESKTEASGARAIASARAIRQALTGDGSVAMYAENSTVLPPEAFALPESAPHGLVNLPDKTAVFVGRERELALLDEAFGEARGVVVQAVHGLGGIGKSTLAAHWAAGRVGSYNPVWWITAETQADLDAGLAELAVALAPALRDVLSREALRERAVQWLAGHDGWLLVLDNVSDPADVKQLLGRATGGRFLITTRRASGWHKVAEPLALDVLEPADAIELFERIDGPGEDIEELCRELGFLPLAVEQAAAYCAEAGITAGRYRELLAAYPREVFAQSAEGTDQARTVARVWRISMDRLTDTPLAERILGVVAWWAPEGIPRGYLAEMGGPVEVTEAVRRLAAHSLIRLHDDDTISVHRLVQAVARAEAPGACRESVERLLRSSWGLRGIDAEKVWFTHLDALAGCTDPDADGANEAWLFNMGGIKVSTIDESRMTELHARAVAAAERSLGPRHEITLIMRSDLAHAHGIAGDPEHAIRLLETNLADHVREFGLHNERTFEARAVLAEEMVDGGRIADGLSLAKENAESAELALGEDHAMALRAWSAWSRALRYWAEEAADDVTAARAADAIEALLSRIEAVEGTESKIYDTVHWNLIWSCRKAGDIARATVLLEESIARRTRLYGETSRVTMNSRRAFVGFLWRAADDQARARDLAVSLVADSRQLLGDDPYVHQIQQAFAPLLTPHEA